MPEALLINSGSAPGVPGIAGALALTSSQGTTPTIALSASPIRSRVQPLYTNSVSALTLIARYSVR